ncbi:MAG: peptide deformylase [Clostridia bacterium]|nr:peptide deformylase [Clostridia bacterium]MBO4798660.1 peptide deformylase [Candidatus Methanomethylophilaceae archaeon]
MAKRNILLKDNPALRMISRPVREITPRIRTLLDDMTETMRAAEGVGLAAPQVGVLRRVVVVETEPGTVYELINPEILESEGDQYNLEGCLSAPGEMGYTHRPMSVRVRAMDRTGAIRDYSVSGFTAQAFCHEIDHLDGILYLDKADMVEPEER